ncbi:MAG: radical SAM/SPASM domain-containing protein [Desulfobaccales bacterium]|jgi:MoaA/NifB/PqqE/SkfB family radical SAM enzyme
MANQFFNFTNFKKMAVMLRDHRPGQIFNTLRFASHALRGFPATHLPYDPHWLVLLITARCNLHCYICSFKNSSFKNPGCPHPVLRGFRDMTLDLFGQILDTYPRAIVVELSGGEPLTNPGIFEMIHLAHARRMKVHIPSNGTLLARNLEAMLQAPVEILNVSFYGTDAASFAQATGADGSLFDATVEAVAELARRRRTRGYPRCLRTSFVCTRDNLHLVPDFIRLSEKMGVDEVKLRNLRFHDIPSLPESSSLNADDPELQDFLNGLRQQRFRIPVFLPRLPRQDDRRKCDHPFRLVAIDGDGFIGPCCVKADKRCWGNLMEQANLWNGPAMLQARRAHTDPNLPPPPLCWYCEERIPERLRLGG